MSESTFNQPVDTPASYPPPPPPPAAKRPWYRKKRFIIPGAIFVVAVIASAASGGSKEDKASTAAPATTAEAPAPTEAPAPETTAPPATEAPSHSTTVDGADDEIDDAGAPTVDAPDALGIVYVHVPVTNNSSKRSDYFIDVVAESADGATQIDTTTIFVQSVEPGQTADGKSLFTEDLPAGSVVRVVKVDRMEAL